MKFTWGVLAVDEDKIKIGLKLGGYSHFCLLK